MAMIATGMPWLSGSMASLKSEFLLHKPKDIHEARKMIAQSVDVYNHKRPHLSLKYETPDAVHQAFFDS